MVILWPSHEWRCRLGIVHDMHDIGMGQYLWGKPTFYRVLFGLSVNLNGFKGRSWWIWVNMKFYVPRSHPVSRNSILFGCENMVDMRWCWTDGRRYQVVIFSGISIHEGTPSHHPFIDGFSIINHPFFGVPHLWKPSYICSTTFPMSPSSQKRSSEKLWTPLHHSVMGSPRSTWRPF